MLPAREIMANQMVAFCPGWIAHIYVNVLSRPVSLSADHYCHKFLLLLWTYRADRYPAMVKCTDISQHSY